MEKEEVKVLLEQLKEILGEDISQEELKREMEKVVLHRPTRDTDDVVAVSVGMPVEAVRLIRDILRKLTVDETMQRSRLCYHPYHLRLPFREYINSENCVSEIKTISYPGLIRKRRCEQEKPNET